MNSALDGAWRSRSPRERAVVAVLAVVLGVALYGWLLQSAGPARTRLQTSVTALQAQAARLDRQAAELVRLRAAPAATASATDLRTLVQARIDAGGLARALVRIDAPDVDHVVVVLGAVAFADWLGWIAGLRAQQVRLEAARIEALAAPGLVSVTATLARPKQK